MATAFSFGDATMYVSALHKGRGWEASARPAALVDFHLHVYEFRDRGLTLACPPEFTDFSVYLGLLMDPRARDDMIHDMLSNKGYGDLDTEWFFQEKLNEYVLHVGLNAFDAGVVGLEINVEIHIHNMARWRREVEEWIAELMSYTDERIGGEELVGVPASKASVKELEVVKYNGGGAEFEENECSICLEKFEAGMEVTRMPCKHDFHGGCLTRWLEKSRHCPLCRYEMPI